MTFEEMALSLQRLRRRECGILSDRMISLQSGLHSLSAKERTTLHILGVAEDEFVVSNVLAWLLTPGESHGLESSFLNAFVSLVGSCSRLGSPLLVDPSEVEVRREVRGDEAVPDVVVLDRSRGVAIVIENKLWAEESQDQTERTHRDAIRYYGPVTKEGPAGKPLLVFLTPRGHVGPHDREFIHLSWEEVLKLLPKEWKETGVHPLVKDFVRNMEVNVLVKNFESFSEKAKLYFRNRQDIHEVETAWGEDSRALYRRVVQELQKSGWFRQGAWTAEEKGVSIRLFRPGWISSKSKQGVAIWLGYELESRFPDGFSLYLYHDNPKTRKAFNEAFFEGENREATFPGSDEGWSFGQPSETSASLAWKELPIQVEDGEALIRFLVSEIAGAAELFRKKLDTASEHAPA